MTAVEFEFFLAAGGTVEADDSEALTRMSEATTAVAIHTRGTPTRTTFGVRRT
jgi:hypothetical protein